MTTFLTGFASLFFGSIWFKAFISAPKNDATSIFLIVLGISCLFLMTLFAHAVKGKIK